MKNRSNVVQLPKVELPGLGIAATASTGAKLPGVLGGVWLCQAYDEDQNGMMLLVKPGMSTRELFTEVLAAQLGQCFRLPCPSPYLVAVQPQHIGRPAGPLLMAYGALQQSPRSLARQVKDTALALDLLDRHKLTEAAVAFDEWIANTARRPANILFDPDNGGPTFFDHRGAMAEQTAPGQTVPNWLGTKVLEHMSAIQRQELLVNVRSRLAAAYRVKLHGAPEAAAYMVRGTETYLALVDFIIERMGHLDRLLSTRILPEQGYISDQDDDHETIRSADL